MSGSTSRRHPDLRGFAQLEAMALGGQESGAAPRSGSFGLVQRSISTSIHERIRDKFCGVATMNLVEPKTKAVSVEGITGAFLNDRGLDIAASSVVADEGPSIDARPEHFSPGGAGALGARSKISLCIARLRLIADVQRGVERTLSRLERALPLQALDYLRITPHLCELNVTSF
jgi:hypothetical protein